MVHAVALSAWDLWSWSGRAGLVARQMGALAHATAVSTWGWWSCTGSLIVASCSPSLLPAMRRALIVEDDPDIVELVAHYLRAEGWSIDSVANGKEALLRLQTDSYQLLILDVQLPGLDGLSVCTEVRKAESTRHLPVVMLTARGDESDRVVGLELGADDYIVKPFSPKELVARVRALLRRTERPSAEDEIIRIGSLSMDRGRRLARWGDEPVHLTAKEFDLLVALLDAHGRVLSRERLLENVWGYTYAEGTRTVDVHIRRLREKLPGVAPKIVTVKGLGYRLARETEES